MGNRRFRRIRDVTTHLHLFGSIRRLGDCQIKAISEGYDPTIGIVHEGNDGSSTFVFDLMEPKRPKVDRAVLDFVKATVFDPADIVIRSDGVCRLNPETARMVVGKTVRHHSSCFQLRKRRLGLSVYGCLGKAPEEA
jgi:hypothetical protein